MSRLLFDHRLVAKMKTVSGTEPGRDASQGQGGMALSWKMVDLGLGQEEILYCNGCPEKL